MSVQSRIPPSRVSTYASPEPTLRELADTTFKAIDQVGVITSTEIQIAVDGIMREAAEVAEQLDELARAIRHHSLVASEYVAEFCVKATSVFDGVVELHNGLLRNSRVDRSERDNLDLKQKRKR